MDESSSPPVLTMAKDTAQVSFADVASSFRRMRTDEFNSGHGRQDMIDISVPSAYVSTPREMVSQPKAMEGMGEFVVDPMQNLIPEGLPLEGRSRSDYAASTSVTSDPLSTSRLRSRGVAVYNKEARSGKA